MSVLEILRWPDPRLSQDCAPVEGEVGELAQDMLDTMYDARGRGLAAPQVGRMIRMFVMDVTWKEAAPNPMGAINPRISVEYNRFVLGEEACLSIPGVSAEIARPPRATMQWTDLDGARQSEVLTGAAARVALHEMDHLNGIVIFDRLDADRRAALEAEYAG